MSALRQMLYRRAAQLGTAEAIASGDPERIAKRVIRKRLYRANGRTMRRVIRWMGL